ncbi:MAG: MCE family protein [Sedimentisphaerales bacterium]|nr:MCE family protein [Sedimentisphaerales bacterium]
MNENRRNIIVAVFVIFGLIIVGWLVFKFGDLPAFVSRYDACEIEIYFPEAPGIQENTVVLFRGYRVGKVIQINPPALLPDLDDPEKKYYQIVVMVACSKDYHIPANIVPKIYRRGLGGNFVDLALEGPAAVELIKDAAQFKGVVSEASEFVSENTQHKLDSLITSLTGLSSQIKGQLTPLPPNVVDQGDPNKVHANVTTAVMRLDDSLKYLNVILGDTEVQRNVKKGLADFAALSNDIRDAVSEIRKVTLTAGTLIEKSTETAGSIGKFTEQANTSLLQVSEKIQNTADKLARTLGNLDKIIVNVTDGKGTVGRAFHDPRLYEALTDATENLTLTLKELNELLAQWKKKGVKTKLF